MCVYRTGRQRAASVRPGRDGCVEMGGDGAEPRTADNGQPQQGEGSWVRPASRSPAALICHQGKKKKKICFFTFWRLSCFPFFLLQITLKAYFLTSSHVISQLLLHFYTFITSLLSLLPFSFTSSSLLIQLFFVPLLEIYILWT